MLTTCTLGRRSVAIALLVALAGPITPPAIAPTLAPTAATSPALEQLVGQKLIVRMAGTTPTADLLGRITRGEVGGVILFRFNLTTRGALVALTTKLQTAARAGGQPPLLICVDQEGSGTNHVPWAPPTMSAREMGRIGSSATARSQGAETAEALRALGINVNLAPVADVPESRASFMYQGSRTFSFDSARTARLADAFAAGLEAGGVLPTMKHFPGIGLATRNTDRFAATIRIPRGSLDAGVAPYRTAIAHGIPLIMLSNATYPAWDAHNAAGWSRTIADTLLRGELGFTGVTMTDSLDGTAASRGLPTRTLADKAAQAGVDLILLTGSEKTTKGIYKRLLAAAAEGSLSRDVLQASYDRILALKADLSGRGPIRQRTVKPTRPGVYRGSMPPISGCSSALHAS